MAITYNSGQEELQGGETIASLNAEKLELQNSIQEQLNKFHSLHPSATLLPEMYENKFRLSLFVDLGK